MDKMQSFSDGNSTHYKFKRDFYRELQRFIESPTNVLVLTGPRKCGKTVSLIQLQREYKEKAIRVDFKAGATVEDAKEITQTIRCNKDIIFLIDEITYLDYADRALADWSNAFDFVENCKTKLIITGSQSIAIRAWSNRAFSATAQYLAVTFINYSEWLRYRALDCTEQSFLDFVTRAKEFTKIQSVTSYLESCLDETIVSNSKSLNVIFNNDCDGLTADILLAVMYTVMFTLYNHVNVNTYKKASRLEDDVKYWFSEADLDEQVLARFTAHYKLLKSLDFNTFRKAILFLVQADLITLTYFSEGIDDQLDVRAELTSKTPRVLNGIDDFFRNCNVCIKYPLFYICVLQELVRDFSLQGVLLGSIVECYVRGLLSAYSYELRRDDKEIDYIDYFRQQAIEFSISNKKIHDTNFEVLGDGWDKILLTKNQVGTAGSVRLVPYFEFINNVCDTLVK